ncbi:MAG: NUDIX domain-containing protein [Syntrophomonas sp.]
MVETHVVTCFIEHETMILLLKRSGRVGSYQQKWAGVSGHLESGNTPLEQALQELREEVNLQSYDISLQKEGVPLAVVDEKLGKTWVVHPFRFTLLDPSKIKTDWEHTEYRWISPDDIQMYETVPNLLETWNRLK